MLVRGQVTAPVDNFAVVVSAVTRCQDRTGACLLDCAAQHRYVRTALRGWKAGRLRESSLRHLWSHVREVSQQPTQQKFTKVPVAWCTLLWLDYAPQRFATNTNRTRRNERVKMRMGLPSKIKKRLFKDPFQGQFQKNHKCRMVFLFVPRPCFARLRNAHQSKERVKVQMGLPRKSKKVI